MARPAKYDWKAIEADYKAGVEKHKICLKHKLEEKTLLNKVYEKKWTISSTAKAVMQGLENISGNLGQIEQDEPEILEAVYDRIKTESAFDISAGSLVMKIMKKLHKTVDDGKAYEKVSVGQGIQQLEPVEMSGAHYLDVANAAYRAKELLKGKEITSSQNINVQANSMAVAQTKKTLKDFYDETDA